MLMLGGAHVQFRDCFACRADGFAIGQPGQSKLDIVL
jgi:hypothetical protein